MALSLIPQGHPIRDPKLLAILAVGFLIIGIMIFAFFSWHEVSYAMEARSWPEMDAEVSNAFIEYTGSSNGETAPVLTINYKYTYGGVEYGDFYMGSDLTTVASNRKEIADALSTTDDRAAEYPPGTRISVHVNPEYPVQSYMSRGFMEDIGKHFLAPGLALLCAAMCLFFATRRPIAV